MRTIYTIKSSKIRICLCYILAHTSAELTGLGIRPNDVYLNVPVWYKAAWISGTLYTTPQNVHICASLIPSFPHIVYMIMVFKCYRYKLLLITQIIEKNWVESAQKLRELGLLTVCNSEQAPRAGRGGCGAGGRGGCPRFRTLGRVSGQGRPAAMHRSPRLCATEHPCGSFT